MVDKNNQVIMCNKAFENIVEMDRQDILGKVLHGINALLQFSKKLPLRSGVGPCRKSIALGRPALGFRKPATAFKYKQVSQEPHFSSTVQGLSER